MQDAIAFANNEVIAIAWSCGRTLDRGTGVAVDPIDPKGKVTFRGKRRTGERA